MEKEIRVVCVRLHHGRPVCLCCVRSELADGSRNTFGNGSASRFWDASRQIVWPEIPEAGGPRDLGPASQITV